MPKDDVTIDPFKVVESIQGLSNLLDEEQEINKKGSKPTKEDFFKNILHSIEKLKHVTAWSKAVHEEGNNDFKITRQVKLVAVSLKVREAINDRFGVINVNESIYMYNGCFWLKSPEADTKIFLTDAAIKIGVSFSVAHYYKFKDDLYNQFKSLISAKKVILDNSIRINLLNGTFTVSDKESVLKPFDKNNFITYQLRFKYNKNAKCQLFQKYLNQVLPNKETQNVLSEFLASVFIKKEEIKIEKAAFLVGTGSNGKSVFYDIVLALLGKENITSYSLHSLTNDDSYERANIENKLLNFCSDINTKVDAAGFKSLTSLEPQQVKVKYKNPFEITNYARLMFNCNTLPIAPENTNGYFRRFLIIPFNKQIADKDQDKSLASKIISTELSGVFNWMLEGLFRLKTNEKFTYSKEVEDELNTYRKISNSVAMFVDETNLKKSTHNKKRLSNLYTSYSVYCNQSGVKPLKSTNFSKRLEALGYTKERDSQGYYFKIEEVFVM